MCAILDELVTKQIIDIPYAKKLAYPDMKRLSVQISTSIFSNECCLWKGYTIKAKKYIIYYFNEKTWTMHRILYANFKEQLTNNEYIRFTCNNKGLCCSVNHMKKFKYKNNNKIENENKEQPIKENKKKDLNHESFIIEFS